MVSTRGNLRSKRFRASSSKLGLRATIALAPRSSNHYGLLLSRNNSMRNACYAGKKRVLLGNNERKKAFTDIPRQNRVTSWLKLNGRNARIRKIYCSMDVIYSFWNICKKKKRKKRKRLFISWRQFWRRSARGKNSDIFWMNKNLQLLYSTFVWCEELCCFWPSASVDNVLLDRHYSSHHTQPRSIIANYYVVWLGVPG